jgi:heptosyltransferase II
MASPATRSLVIAPQWIGDAVMTEPLMRRLHARGERITVGALPWVAPVYRAMPQVAQVIEFPFQHGGLQLKARRLLARSITGQFDVAYVCPNSLKSALLPLLAGIPKRVGYLGEARVGLLTHRLRNPSKTQRPPMVAFYSALSGEANQKSAYETNSELNLPPERPSLQLPSGEVDAALASLGLQRGGYVVLAPGAEYGTAKRWPPTHFSQLARTLGLPVVLLGSAKEALLCESIAEPVNAQQPNLCLNLAGKTPLALAFALISAAKSIVSNDSGLMHVAAAFGVRQVAIFGSSSPLHTPPLNDRATVLWLKTDPTYQPPLDCSPCFERECPLPMDKGHMRCLNDISPAQVLHALTALPNRS